MKKKKAEGTLGMFYYRYPNFGDMLNEFLPERLLGRNISLESFEKSSRMGIGSILDRLVSAGELGKKDRELQLLADKEKTVHIWGSGLLYDYGGKKQEFIRKAEFQALRGELTRKQVSKILGSEVRCVLGDPGLLASMAVPAHAKVWDIGIIPHHKEVADPAFLKLEKKYKDAVLIDPHGDPETVLRLISQCRKIISSSLHGVIVSDSYGIPNCWVRTPGETLGNSEYKYHDYFSAFGTDRKPFILDGKCPDVKKDFTLSWGKKSELRKKQRELLHCFPLDI